MKRISKSDIEIITDIELEVGPTVWNEFELLNPAMKPVGNDGRGASNENCSSNFNYLFEFDDITKREQESLIKSVRGYINRVVFSGSKSYHCIVTINEDLKSEDYKFMWGFLNENLFEGKADKACSNPARRTRKPEVIRKDTGLKQDFIFQRDIRLDFEYKEFYNEWLRDKEINEIAVRLAGNNRRYDNEVDLRTLAGRNINQNAKDLINGNLTRDGTRHARIFSAVSSLNGLNRTKEEVYELAGKTGIKDWKTIVDWVYRR
jgi:hypothetical protein